MADEKKNKLTPMDIHDKEFKRRGRNGYDRYEVDSFLDQIVDDYGDVLDQTVDLKNKVVSLNQEVDNLQEQKNQLQNELSQYANKEQEVNDALISAQESANKIKSDAKEEAEKLLADAKNQAATDTSYERQQTETLSSDYDRLKQEVGQFRNQVKSMLQKQIDNLDDDNWQQALDKYFDTARFYPEDGSEPIETVDESQNEATSVDNSDNNAVESSHKPGDKSVNNNPTIVFPDDYKN